MIRRLPIFLLLLSVAAHGAERFTVDHHAAKLANLIDPAKLATLRERGANPRIQKVVAILADAEPIGLEG